MGPNASSSCCTATVGPTEAWLGLAEVQIWKLTVSTPNSGLAASNLLHAIPALQIDAYFVDFEGIWEAEPEAA
jgi:hypothetical protein